MIQGEHPARCCRWSDRMRPSFRTMANRGVSPDVRCNEMPGRCAVLQIEKDSVVASKYRLLAQVGLGGMGAVWAARHMALDMSVAIKFVIADVNDEAFQMVRARFEREARLSARIRSAHVIEVKDYGVEEDVPYLVMELLEGEDLAKRMKREHRLSLRDLNIILRNVCKALSAVHAAGVVHRDLKPGNIFLARVGVEEITKVLDFGVAKGIDMSGDDGMTRTGMLIGTPIYMSPEQVRDAKRVDGRSDLWSLAVIAFRALTDSLPFSGEQMAVVAPILRDAPPAPSSIVPELGRYVDAFFERALAKDPAARFQTAEEFAGAFDALCVEARPVSPGHVVVIEDPDRTTVQTQPRQHVSVPEVSTTMPANRDSIPGEDRPTRTALSASLPFDVAKETPSRRVLPWWLAATGLVGLMAALLNLLGDDPVVAAAQYGDTAAGVAPSSPAQLPLPPATAAPSATPTSPPSTSPTDEPRPDSSGTSSGSPPAPSSSLAARTTSASLPGTHKPDGDPYPEQPVRSRPAPTAEDKANNEKGVEQPAQAPPSSASPPPPPPPTTASGGGTPPMSSGVSTSAPTGSSPPPDAFGFQPMKK